MEFVCQTCDKHFFDEALPRRGELCFGCHIKTLHIGFSHGKENFHGATLGEKQRKIVSDAASKGITVEPVGARWI